MLSLNWCKKQVRLHNKNNDTKCYDLMGMKNNEIIKESDKILNIWNDVINNGKYLIFSKDYDNNGRYTIIQFVLENVNLRNNENVNDIELGNLLRKQLERPEYFKEKKRLIKYHTEYYFNEEFKKQSIQSKKILYKYTS